MTATTKALAVAAVFLLPFDAFAQQQLRLTIITDPPGGTLYQGPREGAEPTMYMGLAPTRLSYKIPRRWKGCIKLLPLKVRWISGVESGSVALEACATTGKHHQFVFMRPTNVPGIEIDAQYAIALLGNAQSAALAEASRPIYISPPAATVSIPRAQHCTAQIIGNQIFSTCY